MGVDDARSTFDDSCCPPQHSTVLPRPQSEKDQAQDSVTSEDRHCNSIHMRGIYSTVQCRHLVLLLLWRQTPALCTLPRNFRLLLYILSLFLGAARMMLSTRSNSSAASLAELTTACFSLWASITPNSRMSAMPPPGFIKSRPDEDMPE